MSKQRTPVENSLRAVRGEDGPAAASLHHREASGAESPPKGNLPLELTSFIGREKEISEVKGLLEGTRLLTLTGSGGCGKTRLALEVAADVAKDFDDGAWWVGLASLSDADLAPKAAASALGARERPGRTLTEALSDHLRYRKLLLVLDNCEHVIASCAALADALLRFCPGLRVLATSREALGVAGEVSWPVPSLSLPDPGHPPSSESLARYEAPRLFVERAAASTFAPTKRSAAAVAHLCHRLDGIPLAIELAAARTRVLSAEQIDARLDDCFRLLTTGSRTALPRQRTLQATMDWSHDLLDRDERTVFRRLSVFAGGFTLEAAEKVCAGDGIEEEDALDLLARLVDQSLGVFRGEGGEARYRLLETIRQYGGEKLRESGEARATRRRHADFFHSLAEEAKPKLVGTEQASWLERLETEHDNLRATLGWLEEEGEAERGLRLATALLRFWWFRGHLAEA
ncbi:MAG: ATP-binding protein, partial [Rubrobacteraceae bacterium]